MTHRRRKRTVSEQWLARLQERLETRGRGAKAALAEKAGCSAGFISKMMRGDVQSSEFVEPISLEMGLTLPPYSMDDPILAELHDAAQGLSDKDLSMLLEVARRMRGDDV